MLPVREDRADPLATRRAGDLEEAQLDDATSRTRVLPRLPAPAVAGGIHLPDVRPPHETPATRGVPGLCERIVVVGTVAFVFGFLGLLSLGLLSTFATRYARLLRDELPGHRAAGGCRRPRSRRRRTDFCDSLKPPHVPALAAAASVW
jgi:hypothetical protein